MATATAKRTAAPRERLDDSQLKEGVKLTATFQGKVYKAEVVATEKGLGIRYNRKTYPSLSAAGKAITLHATNGRSFWRIAE